MSATEDASLVELLAQLEDIVEPAPVSYLPQTAAWWVLAVVITALCVAVFLHVRRRWRASAYRREALAAIDEVAARVRAGDEAAAAALPGLLRRAALSMAPRNEIASLTGERWLAFLDEHATTPRFRAAPGRRLLELAYAPASAHRLDAGEREALVALCREWVREHRA